LWTRQQKSSAAAAAATATYTGTTITPLSFFMRTQLLLLAFHHTWDHITATTNIQHSTSDATTIVLCRKNRRRRRDARRDRLHKRRGV
jgi:hypothetical protein